MAHLRPDAATASRADASRVALLAVAALLAALAALALRPGGASAALTPGFMDPAFQTEQPDTFWADMTTLKAGVLATTCTGGRSRRRAPSTRAIPTPPSTTGRPSTAWSATPTRTASQVLFTLWRTPFWARADGGRGGSPACTPSRRTSSTGATSSRRGLPLLRHVRPGRRGPARPRCRSSASGRCGTSRTTSAPCARSASAPGSSRPPIYTGILNAGYKAIGEVERAFGVQMDVLGGSMNRGFGGAGSIPALSSCAA